MSQHDELWNFVYEVFGTSGHTTDSDEDSKISCEGCGRLTESGEESSVAWNDENKQILDCCFQKVFGKFKDWVDKHRIGLLEYLLGEFGKSPLHDDWGMVRFSSLKNAATAWQKELQEQTKQVEQVNQVLEKISEE